jgi:hypothetical protein
MCGTSFEDFNKAQKPTQRMKSIRITGISGFVGGYFTRFIMNKQPDCVITE